jgi:hypothetical protein
MVLLRHRTRDGGRTDDDFSVAVYVVIDETMRALAHHDHPLAAVSDAEVLTVAVVAAKQFPNHHALALAPLQRQGDLSGALSASRPNRRLHALGDRFGLIRETLGELRATGDCFLIDRMPVPACRRARAGRCRAVRGRGYCGACPAKGGRVFGWRRPLVCTTSGIPVAFDLPPAGPHDLTPIDALTAALPDGATVYGDKGYHSAPDARWLWEEGEVRRVPHRKRNMWPNAWDDALALHEERRTIETVNSQRAAMGLQRLPARTVAGLELTVHASLLALTCARAA